MPIEMQDVVDDNDNVVQTLSRDEIWQKGLQSRVRVINVFVKNSLGQILVPIRSLQKKNWPGCYDFSCGENVQAGETYDQALKRGMVEELGITDFSAKLIAKLTPADGEVCFMKVFEVTIPADTFEFKYDQAEVEKVIWMDPSEINNLSVSSPEKFKNGYPQLFNRYYCL